MLTLASKPGYNRTGDNGVEPTNESITVALVGELVHEEVDDATSCWSTGLYSRCLCERIPDPPTCVDSLSVSRRLQGEDSEE